MAFGGVGLHLGEGHGAERLLLGGVVVDVGLGHVGEDEERVGGHLLGEQGGGEVLVDDRVDAREGAALAAHHGDAAAARADDADAVADHVDDRLAGHDLDGLGAGHHAAPAPPGVLAHGVALLEHHLLRLGFAE